MCDDFFDDDMDGSIEADNDQENLEDEEGEEWEASEDELIDELDASDSSVVPDIDTDHFDLSDAIILGMLSGSAYDSAIDEKNQSKLIKSKSKPTK